MKPVQWMACVVVLAPAFLASSATAREPVTAEPDIPRLVNELDSPDYATRVRATRLLMIAGGPSVEALRAAALEGSLEKAARAIKVLNAMYGGGTVPLDDETLNRVESALVALAESKQPSVAGRANAVLENHYEVRERLALIEIKRLNGKTIYDGAAGGQGTEEEERRYAIALTEKWAGGDAGLAQIKRLTQLTALYIIDGAPISEDAINDLRAARPALEVQERGRALMGIAGGTHPLGCLVTRVNENGAADKAGIKMDDVVTHFAEEKTPDFQVLTALIRKQKQGDTVDVQILVGGRPDDSRTVKLTLGGWD